MSTENRCICPDPLDGRHDPNCMIHGWASPACSGECLTGADIGVPGTGIAHPHPDCPIHGDRFQSPACSSPASNHGDGRGCQDDNCPRHGEPRERPWEYVLGPLGDEG